MNEQETLAIGQLVQNVGITDGVDSNICPIYNIGTTVEVKIEPITGRIVNSFCDTCGKAEMKPSSGGKYICTACGFILSCCN